MKTVTFSNEEFNAIDPEAVLVASCTGTEEVTVLTVAEVKELLQSDETACKKQPLSNIDAMDIWLAGTTADGQSIVTIQNHGKVEVTFSELGK